MTQTINLYDAIGRSEKHNNLAEFPVAPADALALKFNDDIEDGYWVVDEDDMSRLRGLSAPLAYTAAGLEILGVEIDASY